MTTHAHEARPPRAPGTGRVPGAVGADRALLKSLSDGEAALPGGELRACLERLRDGRLSSQAAVALLVALAVRPLRSGEMLAFVRFLHEAHPPLEIDAPATTVNVVGTGGGRSTFNVSTAAAIVASAAGAIVVKSGSGAQRSACGSLDVLRALGVSVERSVAGVERRLARHGVAFLGAELYPPLLRRLAALVQPLDVRWIGGFLNRIGPLLCPVRTTRQLTGVARAAHLPVMAEALHGLGRDGSVVCWAEVGVDEMCSIGRTHWIAAGEPGARGTIDGAELGFVQDAPDVLAGGDPRANARTVEAVLGGRAGDVRTETVVLNAAVLLVLAGSAPSLRDAIAAARDAVTSGRARARLRRLQGAA